MKSKYTMSAALVAILSGASGGAFAQDAAGSSGASAGQLSEIVVVAQRRSENLQEVPVSVATISSDALEKSNISGAFDLQKVVPGLTITTNAGSATPFIRGVGNSVASAGNEGSTAVYIDGVYIARVNPVMLELNNIERVEVLKGPQGTLFGRNATGGLIHLITSEPGDKPQFKANVGMANYQTFTGSLYAAAPINDQIAGSIAVTGRDQGKGWGQNLTVGGDVWYNDYVGTRTKWILRPTTTTKVTLTGDYSESKNDLSLFGSILKGTDMGNPPGYPPAIYPSPDGFFDTIGGQRARDKSSSYGLSGRIDQEMDFADLVSITAYRSGKSDQVFDVDYIPIDYFNADLRNRFAQFSQELQVVSKPDSPIKWIVGAYYFRSNDGYDPSYLGGAQFGGATVAAYGKQVAKSYAGYAQATAPITDRTNLTLGLRYTYDDVTGMGFTDIEAPKGNVLVPGLRLEDDSTFKKLTWRAAVDHKFTDDVLGYASFSRGYKSGVYPTLPIVLTPAKPEVLDAYEVGFKTEWLDRRLRANIAVYYYDIKNPQVQLLDGPSVQLLNAGSSSVKGVDLDLEAAITSRLTATLGVSYIDAQYDEFINAPIITSPARLVNGTVPGCSTPAVLPAPGNGGNVLGFCSADVSGNRITRSPEWTGTLALNYSVPIPAGELDLSVDASYNDGFYWDPDNFTRQKSFTLLGASAQYIMPNDAWSIRFWGKNLTNEKHYNGANEQDANFGTPGAPAEPRTYGLTIGVQY